METERWRIAWRDCIAPLMSERALKVLAEALETDDQRLVQSGTVVPDGHPMLAEREPTGACAIGLMGWLGYELRTAEKVIDFFERTSERAIHNAILLAQDRGEDNKQQRTGAAMMGDFLEWFDSSPRDQMRFDLLQEVWRSLAHVN
jgi:hypothetical protein